MKAIIRDDHIQATVAVIATHFKQVHVVKIHSHEQAHSAGLIRIEIIRMLRTRQRETPVTQVKPRPILIAFKIWIKADKQRDMHHEDKMEIGKTIGSIVKP